MQSFDIVSEVNMHEVTNAVDQAKREVSTRFDFKGSDARFEHTGSEIILHGDSEFQIKQMRDILIGKFTARKVDLKALVFDKVEEFGKGARQKATIRQGIETEMAKKMVKMIKDMKMKVQAAIQGDQVRVSGKKRDDLQKVMAMLKDAKLDIPLQFVNYRN
ncbi:YajQ family cyclic di-GMP-binding protein [candidate division KSB1 bacterium]|nr:YajQ family cyclic di-GMP-binding protein [candidate division KSB1 bacterium]